MKKRTARQVDPLEVSAVVEFMDAAAAINEFKAEHAAVFAQLEELAGRYNAALEQAEKVCRSEGVSSGPFHLYQFTTKYNARELFNAVGRDEFLKLGGSVTVVTEYGVDKGRLEAAIAQDKVTEDIVRVVRTETPNFHKPTKLEVP